MMRIAPMQGGPLRFSPDGVAIDPALCAVTGVKRRVVSQLQIPNSHIGWQDCVPGSLQIVKTVSPAHLRCDHLPAGVYTGVGAAWANGCGWPAPSTAATPAQERPERWERLAGPESPDSRRRRIQPGRAPKAFQPFRLVVLRWRALAYSSNNSIWTISALLPLRWPSLVMRM